MLAWLVAAAEKRGKKNTMQSFPMPMLVIDTAKVIIMVVKDLVHNLLLFVNLPKQNIPHTGRMAINEEIQ